MKQKQNSICYASCIHCVTQRIYCMQEILEFWKFNKCGQTRYLTLSRKKKLKQQLIFKRNQTQEQLSTSKAADGGKGGRDRDIFSLWSTHGKTVHGNEHSDSVWFSDDSWVTAGDLHVKVAKKAFRSISCHIIEVATFTSLRSPSSLFEFTSFTFWGHKPAFFNVS